MSPEQLYAVHVLEAVLCGLSVVGSLVIVVKLLYYSVRRTFCEACLLYMSLGDIVVSFWLGFRAVLLLSGAVDIANEICKAQGFFVVTTYMAINLWTAVYSLHVFNILVYGFSRWSLDGPDVVQGVSHLNMLHAIIWTISVVFGVLAEAVRIEDTGLDCFIAEDLYRQFLFYIPVYATMLMVLILYGRMILFLRASSRAERRLKLRAEGNQLIWKIGFYPIAYLLIWVPAVAHRLYEAIDTSSISPDAEFVLTLAQAISWSSQGFINFIVYGLVSRRLSCLCCVNKRLVDVLSSKPVCEPTYGEYDEDGDPFEISVRSSVNLLTSPFLYESVRE